MCPGVDSAGENEYQETPGGKDGRCVRLTTYHLHSADYYYYYSTGFYNPFAGFSLLSLEVSRSHTRTHHSR